VKPVYQTIFGPPHGNCLQAAVASILELNLDEVPNFMAVESEGDWLDIYIDFMARQGLQPLFLDIEQMGQVEPGWVPLGWHLMSGVSPRCAPYHHEIVCYRGEPIHDPYPGGGCELKTQEHWTVFISALGEK